MILGHGIDLVSLERFKNVYEKFNVRFLHHFLAEKELLEIPKDEDKIIPFLAKHWAVKEAVSKAIGCGLLNGSKLHFKDIVLSKRIDKPFTNMPLIVKTSKIIDIIQLIYGIENENVDNLFFHVSTSGDSNLIMASAIIEIT